jgi:uncharacterized protein (DUF433 family)
MKGYRLDPANLPQLTDEQARRLDKAEIDYSDIPELGDAFFAKARRMTDDHLWEKGRPNIGGIDWSQCADAERIPGKLSGEWCVKEHRVRCQDILDNAEAGCSAKEIATEIYELPLAVVCRVLRFAYRAELQCYADARRKWPNLPDHYRPREHELTHKLAELDRALRPRPTRKPLP